MVRIRLRRVGAKKQPSYRVVVADARSPRDGRFIETIGLYNPRTEPPTVQIKEDRALHWLSVGAQPSDPVARMLKKMGTFDKLARLKAGEDMETLLAEPAVQEPEAAPEVVAEPATEAEASKVAEASETEIEALAEDRQ